MTMNTVLMIVGVVLLVLAGVFYFANIVGTLVIPLLIIGVLLVVAGLLVRG